MDIWARQTIHSRHGSVEHLTDSERRASEALAVYGVQRNKLPSSSPTPNWLITRTQSRAKLQPRACLSIIVSNAPCMHERFATHEHDEVVGCKTAQQSAMSSATRNHATKSTTFEQSNKPHSCEDYSIPTNPSQLPSTPFPHNDIAQTQLYPTMMRCRNVRLND